MNGPKPRYAIEKELSFFRGDDWSQRFTLGRNGVSFNLTGCGVECKMAQGSVKIEVEIDTTELANGAFTLSIARSITGDMLGQYSYDVAITDTLDKRLTRVFGTLTVLPDVR